MGSVHDRFWAKVEKTEGCWLWLACTDRKGYGRFQMGSRTDGSRASTPAQRAAWVLERGPIPEGMCVCHHCDNPSCVRPSHLFLGTIADNQTDMARKGRAPGKPKLTAHQVERARVLAREGWSQRRIGAELGVDQSTISLRLRGKTKRRVLDV